MDGKDIVLGDEIVIFKVGKTQLMIDGERVYTQEDCTECPKYRDSHIMGCAYSPAMEEANIKGWTVMGCMKCPMMIARQVGKEYFHGQ